jgi:hypothetical protein
MAGKSHKRGRKAAGSVGPAAPSAGATSRLDIPNLDHSRVDYWIGRFQTDKRSDFETYLNRMGRYASLISAELAKRTCRRTSCTSP